METSCDSNKMEEVRLKLGFKGCFSVDCIGKSSGLYLLWAEEVDVVVNTYTRHHIDVRVEMEERGGPWRLIGFYGWSRKEDKHHLWSLLKLLAEDGNDAWLRIGDFNQVLHIDDKSGGLVPD